MDSRIIKAMFICGIESVQDYYVWWLRLTCLGVTALGNLNSMTPMHFWTDQVPKKLGDPNWVDPKLKGFKNIFQILPESTLETSMMVRMACLSSVLTWKCPPVSMDSPSRCHEILGLGFPVKGILITPFSPLSKKAESRKRGGTFRRAGVLILSSAWGKKGRNNHSNPRHNSSNDF